MKLPLVLLTLAFSAPALAIEPTLRDREPLQRPSTSSVSAQTTPVAAPEVDLAGAPAAFTLLLGSIAILSGVRPRRRLPNIADTAGPDTSAGPVL
jgi:hypothetical protein